MRKTTVTTIFILLGLFAIYGFVCGISRFIAGDIATGFKICGLAVFGSVCLAVVYKGLPK